MSVPVRTLLSIVLLCAAVGCPTTDAGDPAAGDGAAGKGGDPTGGPATGSDPADPQDPAGSTDPGTGAGAAPTSAEGADGRESLGETDPGPLGEPAGQEPAGTTSDPEPMADPCAEIECGHGHCEAPFGEPLCVCDFGFTGDLCDTCAPGRTGEDCDSCAEGYAADASGACLGDPCAGDPCNGGGACIPDAGLPVCRCDARHHGRDCSECAEGYAGDDCSECADGYSDPDGSGCQLTACIGVDCAVGGTCGLIAGAPVGVCVCDAGHTGDDCGECQVGYSDDGTGHCVYDLCGGVDCGHGSCIESPAAPVAMCICDDGYVGADCDQCAEGYVLAGAPGAESCQNVLPVTDGLHLWFDAADLTTIDFAEDGGVLNWWDKTGSGHGADHQRFYSPASHRDPDLNLFPPAVHFSQGQHLLSTLDGFEMLGPVGSDGDFTILIVAEWSGSAPSELQTVIAGYFHGWHNGNPIYKLARNASDTLEMIYNPTFTTETPDVTTLDGLVPGTRQLVVTERRPFLNGFVQTLESGADAEHTEAMHGGPIETDTIAIMGSRVSTLVSLQEAFNGSIHEVLIFTSALSSQDREAIDAYLKVKWGL